MKPISISTVITANVPSIVRGISNVENQKYPIPKSVKEGGKKEEKKKENETC